MSDPQTAALESQFISEINEATGMKDLATMTAKEAIEYIGTLETIEDVRSAAVSEEQGKKRSTVLQAVGPRMNYLNAQLEAQLASEEAEAEAPAPAEAEAEPTEPAAEPAAIEEEPVIESEWEGEMGRYTETKHYSRTMHPLGGLDESVKTPAKLNAEIKEDYFDKGFELIKVIPQGFGPEGVGVLWVLGKVREGLESKHSEIWHIQRTLSERPMETGSITGFRADAYIKTYLDNGWQLFSVDALQSGQKEIPMLWVLVR